jgi:hypothetical protein
MKTPALLLAASGALLFSSCVASPSQANDHWDSDSIAPRISRVMLGYDPDQYENYREYQWENKLHIAKTLQRHLLNHNPDNPFQPDDPDYYAARPNHSPLPNPLNYFHLEALAFGAIMYASGGVFYPIPVDSIIGTLEPGGEDEFVAGLNTTFRPLRVITVSFLDDALGLPAAQNEGTEGSVNSHITAAK